MVWTLLCEGKGAQMEMEVMLDRESLFVGRHRKLGKVVSKGIQGSGGYFEDSNGLVGMRGEEWNWFDGSRMNIH